MATWIVNILGIVASLLPMINWADLVPANLASHIGSIAMSLANIIGELIGALHPATATKAA